jgi:CBS domain-containing protein
LTVFTDFEVHWPLMLEHSVLVVDAREIMKKAHVRLKLIIDKEEHFKGVVTAADLVSIRVGRAQQKTGLSLSEITVDHVMTPREYLHAIHYEDLSRAKIGDVLETMRRDGDQHLLVADDTGMAIRGIISTSDIARALHLPVTINERATSFAEVCKVING